MAASRGEFSSRFGFVMAAAGSAVGLGNIWGFPTQAASNGGAAFLLVYLVLAFTLAYPVLMAELIIGRHAHANAVNALRGISTTATQARLGTGVGVAGVIVAGLILSFYAIVAGWMISFGLASLANLVNLPGVAQWLTSFATSGNLVFTGLFMLLTISIISAGVSSGIERWSARLMPIMLFTLICLVAYVMTLEGAAEGLRVYLLPDFGRALSPSLIVAALGSAFFSLSLGVGTMLIYGSYLKDTENLPVVGGLVTLVDILIAVTAGFLVLPAMYAALHKGVQIYTESGALLSEDTLIFTVLPELFATMGTTGLIVSITFFFLMTLAALTSSISMLEVPVAYAIEEYGLARKKAVYMMGTLIAFISATIIFNFDTLFGLVITVTTRYGQPLLGLCFCLFAGWVWQRNSILQELKRGSDDVENSLFWKIWPWYIKLVCPVIILAIFAQSLIS